MPASIVALGIYCCLFQPVFNLVVPLYDVSRDLQLLVLLIELFLELQNLVFSLEELKLPIERQENGAIPVGTEDKIAPAAMIMPLNSGLCVRGRNVGRWINESVFVASDLR
jgi:hypothetical protein